MQCAASRMPKCVKRVSFMPFKAEVCNFVDIKILSLSLMCKCAFSWLITRKIINIAALWHDMFYGGLRCKGRYNCM